jgi:3-phenylpropionate/trans-cinnamate dioxygenase ferredoxin subunit
VCLGRVTGLVVAAEDEPYKSLWIREGEILRCPWHGWEFEIKTGRSHVYPHKKIHSYPVAIEDGLVVVEGLPRSFARQT